MKTLSIFIVATMLSISTFAQLSNGSIAPDFTMTDLKGVEHNMYSYLNDGYTVIIDFSATWWGSCWNYHKSGSLEDLYVNHGPKGFPGVNAKTTDDVMVFFIEGDKSSIAQLNGEGSGINWVEGTSYPILPSVAPNNNQVTSDYKIGYFPTIYMICPNRIISENNRISSEDHYTLVKGCQHLGIKENKCNNMVNIYPIPTSDILNLKVIENTKINNIKIIDISGKTVINIVNPRGASNNYSIPVDKLVTGSYFIVMNTDKEVIHRKFIKK